MFTTQSETKYGKQFELLKELKTFVSFDDFCVRKTAKCFVAKISQYSKEKKKR